MKVLMLITSLFLTAAAANAGDLNDLKVADRRAVIKSVSEFMVPYSKALEEAHFRVVPLLSKCMNAETGYQEFPADLLEYDPESICFGNKSLLKKFEKIWTDTDPKLGTGEYHRYRDYQTISQLGHEAYAAGLLALWSKSMKKRRRTKFNDAFVRMFGEFRNDYDGYINFPISDLHFSRGDGCFMELLVGTGDLEGKGAHIEEICD